MGKDISTIGKRRKSTRTPLSLPKKLLFSTVALVGFFALAEAALTVLGVRPLLYDEDPYVGFASRIPLFVEKTGPEGQSLRVTSTNKLQFFNAQEFETSKPPGTYRVFCLGGSTTYGRPYEDGTSFCGWLRELLPKADASRRWELINAGGISYASYRVAALMEELAEYEPDLFIVYSGHNEALENRTYRELISTPEIVTEMGAAMSRTRVFTFMRKASNVLSANIARANVSATTLPPEVVTRLDSSIGPEDYVRDDVQRDNEHAHYRFNLERMVDIARASESEIVLVSPSSNLKDCSPFKSVASAELSDFKRGLLDELLARADAAERSGDQEGALAALAEASAVDPRHALVQYRMGRSLYAQGRYEAADRAFRRAREEDVCPLRARSAIADTVRDVAQQKGVAWLDFPKTIQAHAANGIPGEAEFLDHVHLTIEGNRILALAIVDALRDIEVLAASSQLEPETLAAVSRRVEASIDAEAHGEALRNLAKVFSWAGKLEESERLAARALAILGEDGESHYLIGASAAVAGDLDRAVESYRRAAELEPDFAPVHNNLGSALHTRGELSEAIEHYRRFLELQPDSASGHYNLGVALADNGQPDEARELFREALRISPEFEPARARLTDVASGPPGGGSKASKSVEALFRAGNSFLAQRRFDEAIRYYQEALEKDPGRGAIHGNLAVALGSVGRDRDSIRHFREVVKLLPRDARGHYNLGTALSTEGDLEGAMGEFEEALRLKPGWDEPAESMASLLDTARAAPTRYAGLVPELERRVRSLPAEGHRRQ